MASHVDKLLEKLNILPGECSSHLRKIQQLDKIACKLERQLELKRSEFLDRAQYCNTKGKLTPGDAEELRTSFKQIRELQAALRARTEEKILLSQKLYNSVHDPTQELDVQTQRLRSELERTNRIHDQQNYKQESTRLTKAGKPDRRMRPSLRILREAKEDIEKASLLQPKYCYCGGPSSGEMVMCENRKCERQWFHKQCIKESDRLPEKWYCIDCRKSLEDGRLLGNSNSEWSDAVIRKRSR